MTLYAGYLYSYPHKTAYRPLVPRSLREVWAEENKDALFLYFHVPFCEMRCGFCNLFTAARPKEQAVADYLAGLERQAAVVSAALGSNARFSRFAIGGGTPTYLEAADLERLFSLASRYFGVASIPTSVETSPETATRERLRVLAAHHVSRISIGVQSFDDAECASIGRPQKVAQVHAALDAIRSESFATLNIDLMYGLPAQTPAAFERSLRAALAYRPEELYLYPLYVRPLTGLGRVGKSWDDQRLELYRFGRALLLAEGYRQVSMRMFRLASAGGAEEGPSYCCQTDGMVGLGPGARSYTQALHYSSEYAVSARGVKEIIEAWNGASEVVDYGIALDAAEQRRRHMILSLLSAEGIDEAAYRARFGASVSEHFPELAALSEAGWAIRQAGRLVLTEAGLERSDAIGPSLCSREIRARMESYSLR